MYTSNVVNEYTAIGGVVPLYDACGNLTKDIHGYTYHYDNDNRITQIKKNNDADEVAAYTYDALGRRIRKYDAVAAAAVRCYYDGDRVLLETDDSNNDQRAFVYGNYIDEVLAMTDYTAQDDPDYYYGHDHLYSVAVIFEADGAVYERAEYNAYGEPTRLDPDFTAWSGTEIGNPYYFTGRNLDTLNGSTFQIYYYRARYYDAEMGRFLQRDPLDYVDGLNLYEYVSGQPTGAIDPFGSEQITLFELNHTFAPYPFYAGVEVWANWETESCADGSLGFDGSIGVTGKIGVGISEKIVIWGKEIGVNIKLKEFSVDQSIECNRDCCESDVCCRLCKTYTLNIGQDWGAGIGIVKVHGIIKVEGQMMWCYLYGDGCPQEGFAFGFCGELDVAFKWKAGLVKGDDYHLPGLPFGGCKALIGEDEML